MVWEIYDQDRSFKFLLFYSFYSAYFVLNPYNYYFLQFSICGIRVILKFTIRSRYFFLETLNFLSIFWSIAFISSSLSFDSWLPLWTRNEVRSTKVRSCRNSDCQFSNVDERNSGTNSSTITGWLCCSWWFVNCCHWKKPWPTHVVRKSTAKVMLSP